MFYQYKKVILNFIFLILSTIPTFSYANQIYDNTLNESVFDRISIYFNKTATNRYERFLSEVDTNTKIFVHLHGCGGIGYSDYDIKDEYELPKLDFNDIEFNITYYNNDDDGIKEVENNINNKFNLDILNNMYHIYLHKNYVKYINYFILDINYLLHAKKYNYDIFLKYINKFLNSEMGIEKILNVYITKNNIKNIILHTDFKMNNIVTKNISILNTGSKKNNSAFSEGQDKNNAF
jgi:hypothetical protein